MESASCHAMKIFLEDFIHCGFVVGLSQRLTVYLLVRNASFYVLGIHGVTLGAICLVALGALSHRLGIFFHESIREALRWRLPLAPIRRSVHANFEKKPQILVREEVPLGRFRVYSLGNCFT